MGAVQESQTSSALGELSQLIEGLNSYLERQPLLQDPECRISNEYCWMIEFAMHAVEKIIGLGDEAEPPCEAVLSILCNMSALRYSLEGKSSAYSDKLKILIPNRAALNDALYWASIERERTARAETGEVFDDDWPVACRDPYWAFDTNSFARLIGYIATRSLQDDKLIALRRAFLVYQRAGRPIELLSTLKEAVAANLFLCAELDCLLYPPTDETEQQRHGFFQARAEERAATLLQKEQARTTWITEVRANSDRIHNFHGISQGDITKEICSLMVELEKIQAAGGFCDYSNWKLLIPDFSESVALAYRTAAISHWRKYLPGLRSEGDPTRVHTYSLSFAKAGLEIEAAETGGFPNNLTEPEVCHALRYITRHSNGLPRWLEQLHRVFPELVKEAVVKELVWELKNAQRETPMHYILSPLVYHGRWLHAALAPDLLRWIEVGAFY